MKILLVHEFYRSENPSGEDSVFVNESNLLKGKGVEVRSVIFNNDDIGLVRGPSLLQTAILTPWSSIGKRIVTEAINNFEPDIVHFHNTFPVISPSAIYQAKELGKITIQTLHNFRYVCAQAMLLRAGKICEKCISRYPWPSVAHRCYRNSFPATLPIFASIALHRFLKTWQKKIDRFIVLSEFNKKKYIEAGFPENKIRVKPNFVESDSSSHRADRKGCLFIGRLKEEKGIQLLPLVWSQLGEDAPELHILGDGPLRLDLTAKVNKLNLEKKIFFHGFCPSSKVKDMLARARMLIVPSICYEGFGLVIAEAYAAGVPVVASRLGTFTELVKEGRTGMLFNAGDIDDLTAKLSWIKENKRLVKEMGYNAQKEFESHYSLNANYEKLMDIYSEALNERSLF